MTEEDLRLYRMNHENGFRSDYDYYYKISRRYTDWDNLTQDLKGKMRFLNQFLCRVHSTKEGLYETLQDSLADLVEYFNVIKSCKIEDVSFNERIRINNELVSLRDIINKIHRRLANTGYGFRDVATTKFMHMSCPNLFIMVDSVIGNYLPIDRWYFEDGYISVIEYYQEQLNELIDDVENTRNLDRDEAINHLKNLDAFIVGSLPRLLDKHFYWYGSDRD
jgi:hypothetical protein